MRRQTAANTATVLLAMGCADQAPAPTGGESASLEGRTVTTSRLSPAAEPTRGAAPARWLMGYYANYERSLYPETTIDFSLLTHIMVGAIEATPTGGVTTDFWVDPVNGPIMARAIATRAHQAGRSAVLMLGGAGYRTHLVAATAPAIMPTFVTNLISAMNSLGYDDIDVAWEPILPSDQVPLLDLVKRRRAAQPSMLLTMPVGWVSSNSPPSIPGTAR